MCPWFHSDAVESRRRHTTRSYKQASYPVVLSLALKNNNIRLQEEFLLKKGIVKVI